MEVLRISSVSKPKSVAGAISGVLRTSGAVELQAIGAGAVNQAVKAIAIARGYVVEDGITLVCVPSFTKISVDDSERTAMKFQIASLDKVDQFSPPVVFSSEGE